MTNEEIQKHIINNCRREDGSKAMDEQAFYEGAKWMRDNVAMNDVIPDMEMKERQNKFPTALAFFMYKLVVISVLILSASCIVLFIINLIGIEMFLIITSFIVLMSYLYRKIDKL